MELVGPPQPLIGAPDVHPDAADAPGRRAPLADSPLPKDAIQPPSLPPPPVAEEGSRQRASPRRRRMSNGDAAIELTSAARHSRRRLLRSRGIRTFFAALARNHGEATGPIFIDRDPTHFRFILNNYAAPPAAPADDVAKRELLVEAEFYALQSFARALCAPELDLTPLGRLHLSERATSSGSGTSTRRATWRPSAG